MSSTNWKTLTVVTNLAGAACFIQDNMATNPTAFYRVVPGP